MHLAQQERACLCTGETMKLNPSPGRNEAGHPSHRITREQEELNGSGFQGNLVCCPGFHILSSK